MVLRSINLHRNIRLGGTTLLAKASFPMTDSSSRLVHVRLPFSSVMAMRISDFRSEVIDASMVVESRRIPKKVREVEGPSSFSGLVGELMRLHTPFVVSILCLHIGESGGPAVKKSSR